MKHNVKTIVIKNINPRSFKRKELSIEINARNGKIKVESSEMKTVNVINAIMNK